MTNNLVHKALAHDLVRMTLYATLYANVFLGGPLYKVVYKVGLFANAHIYTQYMYVNYIYVYIYI